MKKKQQDIIMVFRWLVSLLFLAAGVHGRGALQFLVHKLKKKKKEKKVLFVSLFVCLFGCFWVFWTHLLLLRHQFFQQLVLLP